MKTFIKYTTVCTIIRLLETQAKPASNWFAKTFWRYNPSQFEKSISSAKYTYRWIKLEKAQKPVPTN